VASPVSQIIRRILVNKLAKPIFTRALAMPMVRTVSLMGPFCLAKHHSGKPVNDALAEIGDDELTGAIRSVARAAGGRKDAVNA
jgi:hypothetical protein